MPTTLARLSVLLLIATLAACGDKDEDTADGDGTSGTSDTADTGDSGTSGTSGTTDDGGETVTCSPSQSNFTGDVVPQAGVQWDQSSSTCGTTEGLPPGDQLVIDDFSGLFGGSGSGLTVKSLSHGTFSNETGFYILSDLPSNTDVTGVFEEGGLDVEVTFNISPGTPSVLKVTGVRFAR